MSKVTVKISGKQDVTIFHEDAVRQVIEFLKQPDYHGCPAYGYDLYLHSFLTRYCQKNWGLSHQDNQSTIHSLSPLFMDACWELCRRGILRPFPATTSGQGTSQGAGFSLTGFGEQWLKESAIDSFVPTEPDRFAIMLDPYTSLFGEGFQERAQEAVRCYKAHAFLACCVMAGAAAETILIKVSDKLGITRGKYEQITKIRQKIISESDKGIKEPLIAYSDIVKIWRDEGMHHEAWETRGEKAYISLAMLLLLARFAKEKWFT